MQTVLHYCYCLLLEPRSDTDDIRRREFILNVLLSGLAAVLSLLLVSSSAHFLDLQIDQQEDLAILYAAFLGIVLGLWQLCRNGRQRLASAGLLLLLYIAAVKLTLHYSFELPLSELLYAVLVVFAGILLKAREALAVAGLAAATLLIISYVQTARYTRPRLDWLQQDFRLGDAVGYTAILCLIALVSWLANRDLYRSLARAQTSEAALAKERDSLEMKVAERTHELKQAQLMRTMELERFAGLGRLSADLLHELANPLTAAGLHLDQFSGQQSPLIRQARRSLQQMERYIVAARRQLNAGPQHVMFSVRNELELVLRIMQPLARRSGTKLTADVKNINGAVQLFGDPVRFNQLLSNLIANSLDACAEARQLPDSKQVRVVITTSKQWLHIQVTDNGAGISSGQLPFIFEPFYSTKAASGRGTGLGLALVKKIAEEDFKGSIWLSSKPAKGTVFTVKLRRP